jgi:hypothetical protein
MPRLKHDLLNHLALKSAQEKLRFEAAKARKAEADAPDRVSVNQYGRPIVNYADQPVLRDEDMEDIAFEFEQKACPHAAVAEYRPGFGNRFDTKHARDHWWFYMRGVSILAALSDASDDILDQISTPTLDVRHLKAEMHKFTQMELRASLEAARAREISRRELEDVQEAELREIEAEISARFTARVLADSEDLRDPSIKAEHIVVEGGGTAFGFD